jgi:glycosyltransferase involved in cell wall biosynthesis
MKILFASTHCLIDPSSGAAIATKDLLASLARQGDECSAVCCGILDFHRETPVESILERLEIPVEILIARTDDDRSFPLLDLQVDGIHTRIITTHSSRAENAPDRAEALAFLNISTSILDHWKPDILLVYGGHRVMEPLMKHARKRNIPVVFHLHNLSYQSRTAFAFASHILTPTDYCRRFYIDTLGLDSTHIDLVIDRDRVVVAESDRTPRFLTFVNPDPAKGLVVWLQIAHELMLKRPDIPLLLVESRGRVADLAHFDLDISAHPNLHKMANTFDPREFHRVTRVLLFPSLVAENAALTAREAMMNGIPVVASDRGGLPETLGSAGFALPIHHQYTPIGRSIPSPDDVKPWLDTIIRLWDDPHFAEDHAEKARRRALRWNPESLASRYREFFSSLKKQSVST